MKKVVKLASLLLGLSVLALALSSCGNNVSGSKYKSTQDEKATVSFTSSGEFVYNSERVKGYDRETMKKVMEKIELKGTYKVQKDVILAQYKEKREQEDGTKKEIESVMIFRFLDGKNKLVDSSGTIWTKL